MIVPPEETAPVIEVVLKANVATMGVLPATRSRGAMVNDVSATRLDIAGKNPNAEDEPIIMVPVLSCTTEVTVDSAAWASVGFVTPGTVNDIAVLAAMTAENVTVSTTFGTFATTAETAEPAGNPTSAEIGVAEIVRPAPERVTTSLPVMGTNTFVVSAIVNRTDCSPAALLLSEMMGAWEGRIQRTTVPNDAVEVMTTAG